MKKSALFLLLSLLFTITVNAATIELYVGDSQTLAAPKPPGNAALHQVAWGCSHKSIKVEEYMGTGARVTVLEYFTGTAEVRCDYYWHGIDNYGHIITNSSYTYFLIKCKPVTLTIDPASMILDINEGQTISYSYSPPSVSPKPNIRFISNNTNVVTVNDNGFVRAVGSGSTSVRVLNNMGPEVSCEITVRKAETVTPTSIKLPANLSMKLGETKTLSYTISPSNAQTSIKWSSDDKKVATVNSSGQVTAVGYGKTNVWAETTTGNCRDFCTISVEEPVTPTSIVLPTELTLTVGKSQKLTYTISPSNAQTSIKWTTDDKSVATVNSSGTVTATGVGKTKVWATTTEGNCKDFCTIIVKDKPVSPTDVILPSSINITEGFTRVLEITLTPDNAETTFKYKSSDTSIVQVYSGGKIKGIKMGTATITVTSANGIVKQCKVNVLPLPEDIKLDNIKKSKTQINNLINRTFKETF